MFGIGTKKAKQTPSEIARAAKKGMRGNERELEREKRRLERHEKSIQAEIKKAAKKGDMKSAKVYAKQLVGVRKQMSRFVTAGAQMKSIGMQMSSAAATATMANAMGTAAQSMAAMQRQMNPAAIAATLQNFQMASEQMGMTEEMMEDAFEALDDDDDEEEADGVVSSIFAELGLEAVSGVKAVGSGALASEAASSTDADAEADALLARLTAL